MTTNSSRIELLNKHNYDTWKLQMEAILVKNDMWEYISGAKVKPEPNSNNDNAGAILEWEKNDRKAKSDIILSISPSELKQVKNCLTSKEMWKKLGEIYQSQGPARKATLLKRLTLHKMTDDGDVHEHIKEFFDTVDKLGDMEIIIHPDQLAIMLLYSLPTTFENFRCAIESRDELPTPDALRAKILEESEARKNGAANEMSNAMFINKRPKKKKFPLHNKKDGEKQKDENKPRCTVCKRIGHKPSDCWFNKKNKKPQEEKSIESGNVCFQSTTMDAKSRNWCLDSGASTHFCHDLKSFDKICVDGGGTLNLANHSSTQITGKGTALLTANVSGDKINVTLNNTSHVPDLRTNLISVSKITDHGYDVVFSKKDAQVVNANGQTELYADRIGELYYVREFEENAHVASQPSKQRVSLEQLHKRLGHANARDIIDAVHKNRVIGVQIEKTTDTLDCDICVKGKMSRVPFPEKTERKTEILDLIHSDVWGPYQTSSLGGAKYFVSFIDDASRWCEIRFLKSKAEVFDATVNYIAFVENQKGKKVKCLQTDNGREYVNREFDEFLKKKGIARRLTVPYSPQQNGIAERKNRTLLDAARCLRLESKVPKLLWAEAINVANYLRNRLPTKSLNGKTPHEEWTGKAPDISHLKIFGCPVLYLDLEPGKSKLDQRAQEGVFVGYSTESKGFRIWIPAKRKIIVSRDVKFLEGNSSSKTITDAPTEHDDPEQEQPKFVDFVWDPPHDNQNQHPVFNESDEEEDFRGFDPNDDFRNAGRIIATNDTRVGDTQNDAENPAENEVEDPRRRRGRPRLIRTGSRGRPRKRYRYTSDERSAIIEEHEDVFISEIPMGQAMTGPDRGEWFQSILTEMISILRNDTWTLVDRPERGKVIGCRIVLRNKFNPDGNLEKRKARLVAQGFSQQPGIHFSETFAPVARPGSIRLVMSLAARFKMKVRQYDVTTAYLNGDLNEEVHMELPKDIEKILEGIISTESDKSIIAKAKNALNEIRKGDKVCLLKKSLYGLRQAGRSWYNKLDQTLRTLGATPTNSDPCLFTIGSGEDATLIATYVDDILVASKNFKTISELGRELGKHFYLKDLGYAKCCLGIEIVQNNDGISMHQRGYVQELLARFDMVDCKPVSTPVDTGTKLRKNSNPTQEDSKLPYRELVGALTYLSVSTRPDIAFAISCLGQFNNCYGTEHWKAAKRVLRYLKGTPDVGISYGRDHQSLKGYVDADWGSCTEDRRSYTGYLFMLGGSPISWDARKQRTVALSTTEAEYMALSECTKEALYLQRFLRELGFDRMAELMIYCDNHSALKLAENPVFHAKTKHIEIRHHFVRNALKEKTFGVSHIPTEEQVADFLTKALPKPKHSWCTKSAGLLLSDLEGSTNDPNSRGSDRT